MRDPYAQLQDGEMSLQEGDGMLGDGSHDLRLESPGKVADEGRAGPVVSPRDSRGRGAAEQFLKTSERKERLRNYLKVCGSYKTISMGILAAAFMLLALVLGAGIFMTTMKQGRLHGFRPAGRHLHLDAHSRMAAAIGGPLDGLGGEQEWVVVFTGLASVRREMSFDADIIGAKPTGSIVIGRKIGSWIALLCETGYMALSVENPHIDILLDRNSSFELITEGNCASAGKFPIQDPSVCRAAAAALNLPLQASSNVSISAEIDRPEGCYVYQRKGPGGDLSYSRELWFSTNFANAGQGAMSQREQICSMKAGSCHALPPATLSSTLPALLCFSVSRKDGSEIDLMRAQFAKGVGIFACNYWTVYTAGGSTWLSAGRVQTCVLPDHTLIARRPEPFIQAWLTVVKDGRFRNARWTVKVDPDAVFLAGRLRSMLLHYHTVADGKVALRTCSHKDRLSSQDAEQPQEDEDTDMGGPLQVMSQAATEAFVEAMDDCQDELVDLDFSEATFVERCLNRTGVRKLDVLASRIEDAACTGSLVGDVISCSNHDAVVFHPLKFPLQYFQCLRDTQGIPGAGYKGTIRR
jgi:hypothetical protein